MMIFFSASIILSRINIFVSVEKLAKKKFAYIIFIRFLEFPLSLLLMILIRYKEMNKHNALISLPH